MQALKYSLLALFIGACLCASGGSAQNSNAQKPRYDAQSPVGVWRGESICTTSAPSCHDEKVVYYIEAASDRQDTFLVRADKIVEGKAITMGSGPWKYNRAKQALEWESGQRLWLLYINGNQIKGTLTESGNIVFRRMTLTRDE